MGDVALDLIFAVPGETIGTGGATCARRSTSPAHISTYGLTYSAAPPSGRAALSMLTAVDEETERAMCLAAIDDLTAAGMEHTGVQFRSTRRAPVTTRCTGVVSPTMPSAPARPGRPAETNHRSTLTYETGLGRSVTCCGMESVIRGAGASDWCLGCMLEGIDTNRFAQQPVTLCGTGWQGAGTTSAWGCSNGPVRTCGTTREGLLISDSLWPELLAK
jgi:hypothetical protein